MKIRFFKSLKNTAQSFLEQYKTKNPATYAAALQVVGGLLIVDGFIGIDNPFEGRKRSGIFGVFISIIVSIAIIFLAPLGSKVGGMDKMTSSTQGKIASVSKPRQECNKDSDGNQSCHDVCDMMAQYTVAGKTYNSKPSVESDDQCQFTEGQAITVKYDPDKPNAWTTQKAQDDMRLFVKLAVPAGIIALLVSLFIFTIRFLSIFFGWKLLKQGRALAKTLPGGTNLATISSEIKQNFLQTVFSGGLSSAATNAVTVSNTGATPQPTTTVTAAPAPQPPTTPQAPPTEPTTASSKEDSTNHTSS